MSFVEYFSPPLVTIAGAHRSAARVMSVETPAGTVQDSMLASQMKDIFDIKGPLIFETGPDIIFWALAAAAVAALAAVGVWVWKRKAGKQEISPGVLPPEESALRKLETIRHLMDGNGKEFYFRLSLIFREYLFDRFGIGAPEMTTEELVPRLDCLKLGKDEERKIGEFFHAGDLVKFAGALSVRDDMETHFKLVRRLIKMTASFPENEDNLPESSKTFSENKGLNSVKGDDAEEKMQIMEASYQELPSRPPARR